MLILLLLQSIYYTLGSYSNGKYLFTESISGTCDT